MGMDAKATIWVGVREEDCDLESIAEQMPKRHGGTEFETIYCGDVACGFGIPVFTHDWDYGAVEFCAPKIESKVQAARKIFLEAASELELDIDAGVWCQTDFS